MSRDVVDAVNADPTPHRVPVARARPRARRVLGALARARPVFGALALAVHLLLGGCYQDVLGADVKAEPDSGSASTTEAPTPTTSDSWGPGVQTVTGATEETTSAGPLQDGPPTIDLFKVKPKLLLEAGAAELSLNASKDVTTVNLWLDGKLLAEALKPTDFPRDWEALSAKDNGEMRTFSVQVEDDEGLMAEAEAKLDVNLPQTGTEKCIFEDLDKGTITSSVSALVYTKTGIYAAGTQDTGAGLRLTVWKLDPNTCELIAGWPKTLANWSEDDALAELTSGGSAIAVAANGDIVIGGNFLMAGGVTQSYVVRLNADGARMWEQVGQVGDEVMAVAPGTGQFEDRVFVGGSRRTDNDPVRTDGAIWIYQATDDGVFVPLPTIIKAPLGGEDEADPNNVLSEWVRAVVVDPDTGNAVAVGEREFKDGINGARHRAFTVQVQPLGGIVGTPWTSWGPALPHDAARSIGACGDKFIAGGWTRDSDDPNAKPRPMLFWIDADGASNNFRHFSELDAALLNGVACDRELKIVSAGQRTSGGSDAQVFSVQAQLDTPVWYDDGVASDDAAGAVACDPRGFCAWGGFRTTGGKLHAVVRVHHP